MAHGDVTLHVWASCMQIAVAQGLDFFGGMPLRGDDLLQAAQVPNYCLAAAHHLAQLLISDCQGMAAAAHRMSAGCNKWHEVAW